MKAHRLGVLHRHVAQGRRCPRWRTQSPGFALQLLQPLCRRVTTGAEHRGGRRQSRARSGDAAERSSRRSATYIGIAAIDGVAGHLLAFAQRIQPPTQMFAAAAGGVASQRARRCGPPSLRKVTPATQRRAPSPTPSAGRGMNGACGFHLANPPSRRAGSGCGTRPEARTRIRPAPALWRARNLAGLSERLAKTAEHHGGFHPSWDICMFIFHPEC